MPRLILGLALLFPLMTVGPARASCTQLEFSQVYTGDFHYVLLPSGSQATDESLMGRFWQAGNPGMNQGDCDETNWLHRCEKSEFECTVQSEGPAFYVHGGLDMPCNPGCPEGEMILLVEDLAANSSSSYSFGAFLVARIDESPEGLFDFSRLGDLTAVPIPKPTIQSFNGQTGALTVNIPNPASGFYALPGVPATQTITAFRLLTFHGGYPPTSRTAWTEVARFPYVGGNTTGSAQVGNPCPSNGNGQGLSVAVALELEGSVLTSYVSRPIRFECSPEQSFGAGHAAETGSGALRLARSGAGDLTLTWGAPCVTPNSFALYEGVLGDWTSHVPRTCAAGSPATFFAPAGDAYFLVVPVMYNINPPDFEGSHGLLRDGSERPVGAQTCIAQQWIVACP